MTSEKELQNSVKRAINRSIQGCIHSIIHSFHKYLILPKSRSQKLEIKSGDRAIFNRCAAKIFKTYNT